jgi:hypothetical protein
MRREWRSERIAAGKRPSRPKPRTCSRACSIRARICGSGFPALSFTPGEFVIKDIVLLGASLWAAGEALAAVRQVLAALRSLDGAVLGLEIKRGLALLPLPPYNL